MLGKTYDAEVCSIARALEVVGERWSLLIVRDALFAGSTRYATSSGASASRPTSCRPASTASSRPGSCGGTATPSSPSSYEYLLTDKGRDLAPALIALTAWGDRWAAPDGPPILYRHARRAGRRSPTEVVCATCGRVDDPAQVQAGPGPGMPADRLERFGTSGVRRSSAPAR